MDNGNRVIFLKHIYISLMLSFLIITSCSPAKRSEVDCAIHNGPCLYVIKGTEVILDINPKPVTTMTELEFTVQLQSLMTKPPRKLLLDLTMPRMNMGENKIILQRSAKGIYQGKGIIVDCPSGRKDWKATVWVPDLGEAEFIFNVK